MVPMLSHHLNAGPNTTNYSEGYNNSLSSKFDHPRPRLNIFTRAIRQVKNSSRVRQEALLAGAAPRQCDPKYVQKDARMEQEKQLFVQQLAFWNQHVTPLHFPPPLYNVFLIYLNRIQHLMGEADMSEFKFELCCVIYNKWQ